MIIESIPYVVPRGTDSGKRRIKWRLQCDLCPKEWVKKPSQVKYRRKVHYCSYGCYQKSGQTKITTCAYIGSPLGKNKDKQCTNFVSMRSQNKKYCKRCNHVLKVQNEKRKQRGILIDMLGGKCVCCGENDPMYLQIDHVNNDGHLDKKQGDNRRSIDKYLELPEKFQLLCANCNHAKHKNGGKLYKPKKKRKVA